MKDICTRFCALFILIGLCPAVTAMDDDVLNFENKPTTAIRVQMQLSGRATVGSEFPMLAVVTDSYGNAKNLTGTWKKADPSVIAPLGGNPLNQVWTLKFQDLSTPAGTVDAPYDDGIVMEFDNTGRPAGYHMQGHGMLLETPPPLVVSGWPGGAADSVVTLNLGTVGEHDGVVVSGDSSRINIMEENGYNRYVKAQEKAAKKAEIEDVLEKIKNIDALYPKAKDAAWPIMLEQMLSTDNLEYLTTVYNIMKISTDLPNDSKVVSDINSTILS